MLAYAYAAKFLRSLAAADRVRERQAAQQRRDRPVGAHRFNNQERNRVQSRPRHHQFRRRPKVRRLARNKKRDDKPPRWEGQRR